MKADQAKVLPLLILTTLALADGVVAQSISIVRSFGIASNFSGSLPNAPLVQGPDGTLYGTTFQGEGTVEGGVFRLNADGTGFATLKMFTNSSEGGTPNGGLVIAGGTLYGTTRGGGATNLGTVFKVNTNGTGFTLLKSFLGPDGSHPYAGLVLSGSTLYGTAYSGGTSNSGTIFSLNTDGSGFAVLQNFNRVTTSSTAPGASPAAPLTLSAGVLYGTTSACGASSKGTIFRINTDGTAFSAIYNANGGPGLTVSGSTIIGTASGTIFELNTNGTGYTTLGIFGTPPNGGVVLSGSTLFGTTSTGGQYGCGTVFKVNTNASGFQTLLNFYSTLGSTPQAGLILSNNVLFGATESGGSSGLGTVFNMTTNVTSYNVLKSFANSDSALSCSSLTSSGTTLYGTTTAGLNLGTAFALDFTGSNYAILKKFTGIAPDGAGPYAAPAIVGNFLFGTTPSDGSGGYGTIYELNTNGSDYSVLYGFASTNATPYAGLLARGGALYGTTYSGGPSNVGTVFKINTNGTGYSVLRAFTNSDGANPYAALVLSGNWFFGTTSAGGASNLGTIFEVSTDGTAFATLKSFGGGDGAGPRGELASSGSRIFGTTYSGGTSNLGTIFSLSTDGTGYQVLKNFTGSDGANPCYGALVVSGNMLYGTTSSGGISNLGVVFGINASGTCYTVMDNFIGSNGSRPQGGLLLMGSTLYGTTLTGGNMGDGVVFRMNIPPLISVALSNKAPLLSWAATPWVVYQAQFATNLNSANWVNLGGAVTATNFGVSVIDSAGLDQYRFYRVFSQ